MIVLALVAVATARPDVSELKVDSSITTIKGEDGYDYPKPEIKFQETPTEEVSEPSCPNGAVLPYCCENGAENADCCTNNGSGAFCCLNGAANADCKSIFYLLFRI